jgi:hypothetical protein
MDFKCSGFAQKIENNAGKIIFQTKLILNVYYDVVSSVCLDYKKIILIRKINPIIVDE